MSISADLDRSSRVSIVTVCRVAGGVSVRLSRSFVSCTVRVLLHFSGISRLSFSVSVVVMFVGVGYDWNW